MSTMAVGGGGGGSSGDGGGVGGGQYGGSALKAASCMPAHHDHTAMVKNPVHEAERMLNASNQKIRYLLYKRAESKPVE